MTGRRSAGRRPRTRIAAPGRWELKAVDEAALHLAHRVASACSLLSGASEARWEAWLAPLAEPLEDGDLSAVAAAARRVKAAFGAGESIADALPGSEAIALRESADALLRTLARYEAMRER